MKEVNLTGLAHFAWEHRHDAETLLFPDGKVRQINWFLTHICSHQCGSCKVPDFKDVKPMNDADRLKALRKLRSISRPGALLSIIGGEPLMTPNLAKKAIAEATQEGFFVSLVTSGDNLTTKQIYELGEAGLKYLNISFDEIHGNYDQENEKRIFSLLDYASQIGIVPVINTVIIRTTDPEVFNAFVERVIEAELFINPIVCSPAIAGGRFAKASLNLVPTQEQLGRIIPGLIRKKMETGRVATGGRTLRALLNLGMDEEGNGHFWHCLPRFRQSFSPGRGHLTMDSDGFVGPCQEFSHEFDLPHFEGELSIKVFEESFAKTTATDRCPGCLFTCYMTEESVVGLTASMEERTSAMVMAQVLARRSFPKR